MREHGNHCHLRVVTHDIEKALRCGIYRTVTGVLERSTKAQRNTTHLDIPSNGPGANSGEKHEPVSDIDTDNARSNPIGENANDDLLSSGNLLGRPPGFVASTAPCPGRRTDVVIEFKPDRTVLTAMRDLSGTLTHRNSRVFPTFLHSRRSQLKTGNRLN
jgi:hypothetical protein